MECTNTLMQVGVTKTYVKINMGFPLLTTLLSCLTRDLFSQNTLESMRAPVSAHDKIFRAEQNHHHNTHKWIEIGTYFPMEEKLSWREIISFSSTVCTVWAKVEKGERRPLFPSATKKKLEAGDV